MLVAPMEKEELSILSRQEKTAKETVSAVLMTGREAKKMPIYFVNRALKGPEVNYTSMEKLVLALVHASKRLKSTRDAAKMELELGKKNAITYRPTQGIDTGQILADFIVKRPEEESPDTLIGEEEELPEPWILFTDGSSCTDDSGAGLILTNPEGMEFTYALRFRFDATNNKAEYEALIARLKIAEQMGVPRSENKKADALSKIASTSFAHLSKQVLVKELKEKSISVVEVLAVVEEEGDTWMTPIFKYLMDGTLPVEVKKARAVKRKSWRGSCSISLLYTTDGAKPCDGYYWPTMHEDARKLIRACQDCQITRACNQGVLNKSLSPNLHVSEGHSISEVLISLDLFRKGLEKLNS
ncbi:reverse transcriptase domain-containing protein [Tanacetum coccineum]